MITFLPPRALSAFGSRASALHANNPMVCDFRERSHAKSYLQGLIIVCPSDFKTNHTQSESLMIEVGRNKTL